MSDGTEERQSLVGVTVDHRFVVLQELGRSGETSRYQAMEPDGRLVELRAVDEGALRLLVDGREARNPFHREVELARDLLHPAVAQVYGFGRLPDGRHYLATEVVDGMNLAEEIERRGRFPVDEALDVVHESARAVGILHERQVVHRTLSPRSFVSRIGKDGLLKVKLVEYALAKYAHERDDEEAGVPPLAIVGPACMAPETAAGKGTSYRTDVYALGAIAIELLAGRPVLPERRSGAEASLDYLRSGEPIPCFEIEEAVPELPPEVRDVLLRCLDRDPRNRPRDAVALQSELGRARARTQAEEDAEPRSGLGRLLGGLLRRRPE